MGSIMLSLKGISLIAFLALASCEENQLSGQTYSNPSTERSACTSFIENHEKRLKALENILLNANISDRLKATISDALKEERSIEDDVQTNKEDIIDLRMTDGRHDFLISDGMAMTNYINNTIIPTLDHRLDTKINDNVAELHEYDAYIDSTRPPLGSIVAWLPAYAAKAEIPSGWQRCDGSDITTGPLAGMKTPDLNGSKRFLRGSADDKAGSMEEDAVQDHQHTDPGHSHEDNGHTHVDAGHTHYLGLGSDSFETLYGGDQDHNEDVLCSSSRHEYCGGWYMNWGWSKFGNTGNSNIQEAKADIETSTTGLAGMSTGNSGSETRPKNMNVVYIMRIL